MKKTDNEIALKTEFVSKNNRDSEKIKTTNINVLLNRVRLDRKKNFQKKVFFSIILFLAVISIAIFFTI